MLLEKIRGDAFCVWIVSIDMRFICLSCLDVESCSLVCWTSLKVETWVVAWKVLTGIGQLLWHACMLFGSWTVLGNWGYNCMDFVLCIKL